jgi:penicillin-binding protein 1A
MWRDAEPEDDEPPGRSRAFRFVMIAGALWACFVGLVVSAYWLTELPETNNLLTYEPRNDVTLRDVRGRLIARRGLTQGDVVRVGELPAHVGHAFIAIEDRRFYSHFGIDVFGLVRAMATNISEGAFVQGGSTITQQLAKNLFLKPERTLSRKVSEAFLAVRLENRYSKDEILTLYLNRVYFGAGVYGIEAAAQRFFSKPAADLSLTEAAMLAGSVKAPSRYNPATDIEAAQERAALVLSAMLQEELIDQKQFEEASTAKPKITRTMATPGAGYFIDYAISLVPGFADRGGPYDERLIVETTLDLDMQAAAERAVGSALERDGEKLGVGQGALVTMTHDGAIRALVGGRAYDDSPFNRATTARRQPGSAFKVFVYLAALEYGRTPYDWYFDGPVTVGNWTPENYEGKYSGEITLSDALARSSNSVAVQLTHEVSPGQVARVARRLGITANLLEVPALALGTSEVTPLELVTAYTPFANGGIGVIPHAITKISTSSGKILYERRGSGVGRVMTPEANADMTQMLVRTVTDGTGTAARLPQRPMGGKTGTSQDYRDAWFVGFTADLVTGVWIGNDDNTPMKRATGGGIPHASSRASWARHSDPSRRASWQAQRTPLPRPPQHAATMSRTPATSSARRPAKRARNGLARISSTPSRISSKDCSRRRITPGASVARSGAAEHRSR